MTYSLPTTESLPSSALSSSALLIVIGGVEAKGDPSDTLVLANGGGWFEEGVNGAGSSGVAPVPVLGIRLLVDIGRGLARCAGSIEAVRAAGFEVGGSSLT